MEVRGHGVRKGSAGPVPVEETTLNKSAAPKKAPASKASSAKSAGVRATITLQPTRSAAARATTVVSAASLYAPRQASVELSLVENLKKQIGFLEAQVVCLKRQQDMAATGAATPKARRATEDGVSSAAPRIAIEDPLRPGSSGLAKVPESYQAEIVSLQLNLERVLCDCEALQQQRRHYDEERHVMADEICELRTALRAAAQSLAAAEAERQAALEALGAEQAGRRLLEEQLAGGGPAAAKAAPELTDVLHQKEYFKLQADRLRTQEAVTSARCAAVVTALEVERAESKGLEAQLCAALDRVGELESHEKRMQAFYTRLGGRFITTAATLRRVLEAARQSADPGHVAVHEAVAAAVGGDAPMAAAMANMGTFAGEVERQLSGAAPEGMSVLAVTPPPAATVSQPPSAAAVPPPPVASVPTPPPPAAVVPPPPPPAAAVPSPPPTATVPALPAPAAAVPAPPAASAVPPVPEAAPSSLQSELALLEARIATEVADLAAYVASNGAEN